jgi:hypothetical protein
MSNSRDDSQYRSGDLVSAEINGEWTDGEYVCVAPAEGHVIYVGGGREMLATRVRAQGGLLA